MTVTANETARAHAFGLAVLGAPLDRIAHCLGTADLAEAERWLRDAGYRGPLRGAGRAGRVYARERRPYGRGRRGRFARKVG